MDNRRGSRNLKPSIAVQRNYDLEVERERQGNVWRRQIERELQKDLSDLDDEAQVRNVRFRSRKQLLAAGGKIRDLKRVMNSADVAAIPYDMLWHFLNESGHQDHWLDERDIAKFLQVSPLRRVSRATERLDDASRSLAFGRSSAREIGRASCRERV